MQHAGLQYGQGAVHSHQSPPFAHADIPQGNGGNTTSSLRQFRKKDGNEKNSSTDLNTSVENSHIARVPPHNHYPARPNDYYRYQHQFPDYNSPYKETPAQVKYSEIAETPPQSIQHVDQMPTALQKHKEVHKDFMDMCNISQQTHMKQNYPDNLTRQQSYPPDAASVHHQYLHKEPQIHPGYKPESQYQQYPQLPKYNMPSQCRKYPPPPPPPENDFLAKLQRINPSMARSIMSDHHIRESQATYPTMDQNRMYPQNQRYYPSSHIQNNISYNYQPYNYPSSCNYKHPEYPRTNQMAPYPSLNPHTDRSISPRNLHMMNYGTSPQKISPTYPQYNTPEYAQHYQHRRTSLPQEYYQQSCRANPFVGGHQISPQPDDNRTASGGLRHFIENWAEEEVSAEVAFKDIRIQHNDSNNEPVFVINSSDIPQCLENVSLVPTENGQYIIKTGALDNSVVRIKETTETNGERTVNVQIVEGTSKADCMLAEENTKISEETPSVPYEEEQNQNMQNEKDCDEITKTNPPIEEPEIPEKPLEPPEETQEKDENSAETSVIVSNEVSVIKDMPLIDEEHAKSDEKEKKADEKEEEVDEKEEEADEREETSSIPELPSEETNENKDKEKEPEENDSQESHPCQELLEENRLVSTTRRTQRIFSVDDIMHNIGNSPAETRRNSLQFVPKEPNEETATCEREENEDVTENMEYRNAVSINDDSVILEIGGAWVQLNINNLNGTKVLSVLPLSESLVIDVNGNYEASQEQNSLASETSENLEEVTKSIQNSEEKGLFESKIDEECASEACAQDIGEDSNLEPSGLSPKLQDSLDGLDSEENSEEISSSIFQSEVVIGEDSTDNEVFLEFSVEDSMQQLSIEEKQEAEVIEENPVIREKVSLIEDNEVQDIKEPTVTTSVQKDLEDEEEPQNSEMTVPLIEEKEVGDVRCFKNEVTLRRENQEEEEQEEIKKPKKVELYRRRDEIRKSRDSDDGKKSGSKRNRSDEKGENAEVYKTKSTQKCDDTDGKILQKNKIEESQTTVVEEKKDNNEYIRKKVSSIYKKYEKKLTSQKNGYGEEKRREKRENHDLMKVKKQEKKVTSADTPEENDLKKTEPTEECSKSKKLKNKLEESVKKKETLENPINANQENKQMAAFNLMETEENKQKEITKASRNEKRRTSFSKEDSRHVDVKDDNSKLVVNAKKITVLPNTVEVVESKQKGIAEEKEKIVREKKPISTISVTKEDQKQKNSVQVETIKLIKKDVNLYSTKREDSTPERRAENVDTAVREDKVSSWITKERDISHETSYSFTETELPDDQQKDKRVDSGIESTKVEQSLVEDSPEHAADVIRLAEEMITKEIEKHPTKAAKKLYINDSPLPINLPQKSNASSEDNVKHKKSISKLEETVKKIKSLKEKTIKEGVKIRKTSLRDTLEKKTPKVTKKVTFNLETEVREINKEEFDKKKLSLQEYNSRKRKASSFSEPEQTKNKIMENTVTSSDDIINEEVMGQAEEFSVQNSIQDSNFKRYSPRMTSSNWEDDSSSPEPHTKDEVMSTTNRKCIIDVNEFSIKPIESASTPSPVSSSQFSYHSEDDSLQVYKDVVDSKLNSLNIKIPKLSKPKPVDRFSVLLDRFLNKGSLNYNELEEVKKFIEIKRKMLEEEKKLTYEVRGERDYKDLKLHLRKVPEKRKKKRFRNLYTEDTSEDSDSSRNERVVGDYSVYQRDSQGVPKLIFKRKSGLPQPFVKLERSQAVELLAKKRKLY